MSVIGTVPPDLNFFSTLLSHLGGFLPLRTTTCLNLRLEALNPTKNIVTIPKHPRALMEHLGAIEMKIASRPSLDYTLIT
jgi:hypothetical protein